jgi:hypothetical protein
MLNEKKSVDTEQVTKKEVEKKLQKLATIKPQRGHKLFEVNSETKEITEAEFEILDIKYEDARDNKQVRKKVICKPGHIYVSALNKKNVIKKLNKQN